MNTHCGFKHVGLLVRKKDMSFEDFIQYWNETHTAIALQLPGLRGYVLNPIDREKYPDSPIDGFSELWFDSIDDAINAFNSPAGKAAYADVSNFIENAAITYVTEIRKK